MARKRIWKIFTVENTLKFVLESRMFTMLRYVLLTSVLLPRLIFLALSVVSEDE
jgi:hypothetical protein